MEFLFSGMGTGAGSAVFSAGGKKARSGNGISCFFRWRKKGVGREREQLFFPLPEKRRGTGSGAECVKPNTVFARCAEQFLMA
jgi:hypothetical protein